MNPKVLISKTRKESVKDINVANSKNSRFSVAKNLCATIIENLKIKVFSMIYFINNKVKVYA